MNMEKWQEAADKTLQLIRPFADNEQNLILIHIKKKLEHKRDKEIEELWELLRVKEADRKKLELIA